MCFWVKFIIKQVVCWFWCSNIGKNDSYVCSFHDLFCLLEFCKHFCYIVTYCIKFSSAPTCIQYCMKCYSPHDFWIILCIALWNCILVSVHAIVCFEVLLAFMFIFETENRIKLSSHNKGQINHTISFLFKKTITGWFWMLYEKNKLEFS